MAGKSTTKSKTTAKAKTAAQQERPKLPMLGIVFGIAAVALLIAVMFAGSEPLGGAEFGEPEITGTALPPTLDFNPADATEDPAFGATIPEVAGQNFAGDAVSITNNGRPKAILFVSHSCPHCQDEIPEVQAWLDSTGGIDGVDLISVSTSANSAASNWPPSEWLESEGWQVPLIADDTDSSAFRAYGGSAIPYWVFVDADGAVTRRHLGRMDMAAVQAEMQGLLP